MTIPSITFLFLFNSILLFTKTFERFPFKEEFVNLVGTFLFLFCDNQSSSRSWKEKKKVDSILWEYKEQSIYKRSNHIRITI